MERTAQAQELKGVFEVMGLRLGVRRGAWLAWIFAALTGLLLWLSLGLSPVSSLIPRIVLTLTLLLLLVEIVVEMKAKSAVAGDTPGNRPMGSEPPGNKPGVDSLPTRREAPGQLWRVLLWIAVLPLGVWLFGVIIGGTLFCLAFLRWWSRESWPFSLTTAVVLGLVLQVLFSWVFQSGLYQGLWTY